LCGANALQSFRLDQCDRSRLLFGVGVSDSVYEYGDVALNSIEMLIEIAGNKTIAHALAGPGELEEPALKTD
jgi:hypothetical protein